MENTAKLIASQKRFLITTHKVPDGDGLGSEMALFLHLKALGKDATIINGDLTPEKFRIVDPKNEIKVYDENTPLPKVDVIFIADTNDWKMLGRMEKPLQDLDATKVFIDHHIPESNITGKHLIDEKCGSTGELVFQLLEHCHANIDLPMATALYVAITSDENTFRYRGTSANYHRIAAALLEKGVSSEQVYQQLYAQDSFSKVRLFGHVLEGMHSAEGGKIAWLVITGEMRQKYHATIEDISSFINQLTLIRDVQIGILFREDEDGSVKVSLRGIGDAPVVHIAQNYGGGGHLHAAGMRIEAPLEKVIEEVCAQAKKLLSE